MKLIWNPDELVWTDVTLCFVMGLINIAIAVGCSMHMFNVVATIAMALNLIIGLVNLYTSYLVFSRLNHKSVSAGNLDGHG